MFLRKKNELVGTYIDTKKKEAIKKLSKYLQELDEIQNSEYIIDFTKFISDPTKLIEAPKKRIKAMKKYETIYDEQRRLFRIKALRNFDDIKAGQLGGFISKEDNLSHDGTCWVYGDAEVFGDAQVSENAKIYDHAKVYDFAKVYGEAQIYNHSRISNSAQVYGDAIVYGDSRVYEDAKVYNRANIYSAYICGSVQVFENAVVSYGPWIGEYAQIKGTVVVTGLAEIFGDAIVAKRGDYLVIHEWWSEHQYITWTRSNGRYLDWPFYRTAKEFIEEGYKESIFAGNARKQIVEFVNKISEIEL